MNECRVQIGSASRSESTSAAHMDDGRPADPPFRTTRHPLRQRHRRAAHQQRAASGRRRVPAESQQRARRDLMQNSPQHQT